MMLQHVQLVQLHETITPTGARWVARSIGRFSFRPLPAKKWGFGLAETLKRECESQNAGSPQPSLAYHLRPNHQVKTRFFFLALLRFAAEISSLRGEQ